MIVAGGTPQIVFSFLRQLTAIRYEQIVRNRLFMPTHVTRGDGS